MLNEGWRIADEKFEESITLKLLLKEGDFPEFLGLLVWSLPPGNAAAE